MNAHEQAEVLLQATTVAAKALESHAELQPYVQVGVSLSFEVASALADRLGSPLRVRTYEADLILERRWVTLWGFDGSIGGVAVRGQGDRLATPEEVAVVKAEGSR